MKRDMWERAQEALFRRGINTVLELALWGMLFYVIVGVLYTVFHIELVDQLESALSGQFTIFDDIAALAAAVLFWPFLLLTAWACGVSGCGLF
jgi:hypothetical protein